MIDLRVKIGEERYELPSVLTVEAFISLSPYELDNPAHDSYICASLLKAPLADIRKASVEDLIWLKVALLQPLAKLDHLPVKGKITRYDLINFSKISIGEFADLDVLISEGVQANLDQIVALLYAAPVEAVLDWSISDVWPAVLEYLRYREQIYKGYKNLFGLDERVSGDSEDNLDRGDAKVAWYTLLMTLCNDRFLDIESASTRPLIEALNYLAYMKQKNLRLKAQMEKSIKKLKSK